MSRGALGTSTTVIADGASLGIWGWAYDQAGIREIQVVVDNKIVGKGQPSDYRADVQKALPECKFVGKTGFGFSVSTGPAPVAARKYEVRAITMLGRTYVIGTIELRFDKPVGSIAQSEPVRWNGENRISGWALSLSGISSIRLLAGDVEIQRTMANLPHVGVEKIFPEWPAARSPAYEFRLAMSRLPRGRYPLTVRIEANDGASTDLPGPEVWNDEPIGKVVASADRISDLAEVRLRIWLSADAKAAVGTEIGHMLGVAKLARSGISLDDFDRKASPVTNPKAMGAEYLATVSTNGLPSALHRLGVHTSGGFLPGPLVRVGHGLPAACPGAPRRMYYPGNHRAFQSGFPEMQSWRSLVGGGCVEVGIRGRVEYLRTTRGSEHDYEFDPDFPGNKLTRNGREMIGVPLRELLDLALRQRAPLLVTLDGGVWADSAFSAPDIDVVDMLELDDRTVQWNQFGRAEPDDALKNLAGSFDDPELARMMSLNRFNSRFMNYKKRNLQAAVREIVAFSRAHPEIDVAINLDPDHYINPWFYLRQWYDYNPDTLRQFREWLFHRGPYGDGGPLANSRYEPRMTLASLSRLAGNNFVDETSVEPPRGPIDYQDPWLQIWDHFKRHLVARHYEDLAAWAVEAGMPSSHIYTSQTFILADVATRISDRATNWTDQAGVSIEGAKPAHGHLGVILYGKASRNQGRPRSGLSLMDNIRMIDPDWASVELHPAVIDQPDRVPSHVEAYQTLQETFNAGARFISPMWGSRLSDQILNPSRFRAYDSMEGTPFEYQLGWWLLQLQNYPVGTLFFPFGNDVVDSLDGWTTTEQNRAVPHRGRVILSGGEQIVFSSPEWDRFDPAGQMRMEVHGTWINRVVNAEYIFSDGSRQFCTGNSSPLVCEIQTVKLLRRVRLSFESEDRANASRVEIERVILWSRRGLNKMPGASK